MEYRIKEIWDSGNKKLLYIIQFKKTYIFNFFFIKFSKDSWEDIVCYSKEQFAREKLKEYTNENICIFWGGVINIW